MCFLKIQVYFQASCISPPLHPPPHTHSTNNVRTEGLLKVVQGQSIQLRLPWNLVTSGRGWQGHSAGQQRPLHCAGCWVLGAHLLREPHSPRTKQPRLWANLGERKSSRRSETCRLVLEGMELVHATYFEFSPFWTLFLSINDTLQSLFYFHLLQCSLYFLVHWEFFPQHWFNGNTKKKKHPTFCFLNTNCW